MIGKRIAELRTAKNLSLDELSKETGFAKSYLWGIEKGKINPTFSKIIVIANALDVTVGLLMVEEQPASKEENVLYIKFNKLSELDKKRIVELIDLWSKKND